MLSRAAEVPGKRAREALLAHADDARLSRDLVTIRRNVPITFDAAAMRVVEPDRAELERLFIELEFRSLIPKLEDLAVPPAGAPPAVEEAAPAAVVSDVAALAAAIAECRR